MCPASSMDQYLRSSRAEAESASHLFRGEAELGDHDHAAASRVESPAIQPFTCSEPGAACWVSCALQVQKGVRLVLLGRESERAVLSRLLGAARDGHGGAIVVLGEPGIGKTALIEEAITAAEGFQVFQTAGHEGEMELAFAALQRLCGPGLDSLQRLPEPQRDALSVVFGITAGDPPDRLLVALAAHPVVRVGCGATGAVRCRRCTVARPNVCASPCLRGTSRNDGDCGARVWSARAP